jgi:hypothetical protein
MPWKNLERILLNHRSNYIKNQQKLGKKLNENTLKEYQRLLDLINKENKINFQEAQQLVSSFCRNLNGKVEFPENLVNDQQNKIRLQDLSTSQKIRDIKMTFIAQHTHPLIFIGWDIEHKGIYVAKCTSSNSKEVGNLFILFNNVEMNELVPLINKINFCKAQEITMEEFKEKYELNNPLKRNNRTLDWGKYGNTPYYNAETSIDENGKSSKISQVIYYIPTELIDKWINKFNYSSEKIEHLLKNAEKFISDLPNLSNLEVYNYGTRQYEKFDKNAIEFCDMEKTHQIIADQCASKETTVGEAIKASYKARKTHDYNTLKDIFESNSGPINSPYLNNDGTWIVGGRRDNNDW